MCVIKRAAPGLSVLNDVTTSFYIITLSKSSILKFTMSQFTNPFPTDILMSAIHSITEPQSIVLDAVAGTTLVTRTATEIIIQLAV